MHRHKSKNHRQGRPAVVDNFQLSQCRFGKQAAIARRDSKLSHFLFYKDIRCLSITIQSGAGKSAQSRRASLVVVLYAPCACGLSLPKFCIKLMCQLHPFH